MFLLWGEHSINFTFSCIWVFKAAVIEVWLYSFGPVSQHVWLNEQRHLLKLTSMPCRNTVCAKTKQWWAKWATPVSVSTCKSLFPKDSSNSRGGHYPPYGRFHTASVLLKMISWLDAKYWNWSCFFLWRRHEWFLKSCVLLRRVVLLLYQEIPQTQWTRDRAVSRD